MGQKRTCNTCRETKDIEHFSYTRNGSGVKKISERCRVCINRKTRDTRIGKGEEVFVKGIEFSTLDLESKAGLSYRPLSNPEEEWLYESREQKKKLREEIERLTEEYLKKKSGD